MLTTIEGVYHNGKIDLSEVPPPTQEDLLVLVTFLSLKADATSVHLPSRGIDRTQAADLRTQLATFAEDWDSPEMEIYDSLQGENGNAGIL